MIAMCVLLTLFVITAPVLGYLIGKRANTSDARRKNEILKKMLEDFEKREEETDV